RGRARRRAGDRVGGRVLAAPPLRGLAGHPAAALAAPPSPSPGRAAPTGPGGRRMTDRTGRASEASRSRYLTELVGFHDAGRIGSRDSRARETPSMLTTKRSIRMLAIGLVLAAVLAA